MESIVVSCIDGSRCWLVWDEEAVRRLRYEHRILGELIGPKKFQESQVKSALKGKQSQQNQQKTNKGQKKHSLMFDDGFDDEEDGPPDDDDEWTADGLQFEKNLPLSLSEYEICLLAEKGLIFKEKYCDHSVYDEDALL
jgi:hypothetical protein